MLWRYREVFQKMVGEAGFSSYTFFFNTAEYEGNTVINSDRALAETQEKDEGETQSGRIYRM